MSTGDHELVQRLRERLGVCEEKRDRLSGRLADARQQVVALRRERQRVEEALATARRSASEAYAENRAVLAELEECRTRLDTLLQGDDDRARIVAGRDDPRTDEPPPVVWLP